MMIQGLKLKIILIIIESFFIVGCIQKTSSTVTSEIGNRIHTATPPSPQDEVVLTLNFQDDTLNINAIQQSWCEDEIEYENKLIHNKALPTEHWVWFATGLGIAAGGSYMLFSGYQTNSQISESDGILFYQDQRDLDKSEQFIFWGTLMTLGGLSIMGTDIYQLTQTGDKIEKLPNTKSYKNKRICDQQTPKNISITITSLSGQSDVNLLNTDGSMSIQISSQLYDIVSPLDDRLTVSCKPDVCKHVVVQLTPMLTYLLASKSDNLAIIKTWKSINRDKENYKQYDAPVLISESRLENIINNEIVKFSEQLSTQSPNRINYEEARSKIIYCQKLSSSEDPRCIDLLRIYTEKDQQQKNQLAKDEQRKQQKVSTSPSSNKTPGPDKNINNLLSKCNTARKKVEQALKGMQDAVKSGDMDNLKKWDKILGDVGVPYAIAHDKAMEAIDNYETTGHDATSYRDLFDEKCVQH